MDKFVRTGEESHFGLESFRKIENSDIIKSCNINFELEKFKKKIIKKINKFNPKTSCRNKDDDLVKLLWISHIFGNLEYEKQEKLYTELGFYNS